MKPILEIFLCAFVLIIAVKSQAQKCRKKISKKNSRKNAKFSNFSEQTSFGTICGDCGKQK